MKTGKQITAARGLLGWSINDLCERTGFSRPTISEIESDKRAPYAGTLDKIIKVIEMEGVQFNDKGGVECIDNRVTYFDHPDWWFDVLDDIYFTIQKSENKEVLIYSGDNRTSPQRTIDGFRKIIKCGGRIREMVEEGNTYLMGNEEDYRWIPSEFYMNHITVIYGDKVSNDFGDYGLVLNDPVWAKTERIKFEMLWSFLKKPDQKSTADVRY